jgi:DNA-directed RNA polymerase subunit alpha
LPIGELPIDAIFSPVRRVNYDVKRARVGQRTNYDRLILEIWTDGIIRPEDAMREAAKILINHLRIVAQVTTEELETGPEPVEQPPTRPDYYDTPIEQLDLSVRVFNSLKRTGITNVGEVLQMLDKGTDAMLAIRNFGEKSLDELMERLAEKGFLPQEQPQEQPVEASSE